MVINEIESFRRASGVVEIGFVAMETVVLRMRKRCFPITDNSRLRTAAGPEAGAYRGPQIWGGQYTVNIRAIYGQCLETRSIKKFQKIASVGSYIFLTVFPQKQYGLKYCLDISTIQLHFSLVT